MTDPPNDGREAPAVVVGSGECQVWPEQQGQYHSKDGEDRGSVSEIF